MVLKLGPQSSYDDRVRSGDVDYDGGLCVFRLLVCDSSTQVGGVDGDEVLVLTVVGNCPSTRD